MEAADLGSATTAWAAGPDEMADAVANSVLLTADEFAQSAAQDYWDMSATAHREVLAGLRSLDDAALQAALDAALAAPAAPEPVRRLGQLLRQRLAAPGAGSSWPGLGTRALRADALGRLYVHVGADRVSTVAPVLADAVPAPRTLASPGARPTVTIVIPFRERDPRRGRLRNLLACLAALGDQSADRDSYRVVVVEIDDRPRWEELLSRRADRYLFARCPGHFNKAWGVNVGVVQAADTPVTCILDADILVDREFVARNAARFGHRGAQAHWPFQDALCLDDMASQVAVTDRCLRGYPAVDERRLRGVYLRRPPGHCVWLWTDLFGRAQGMDERFQGWGGEDLDFVFRLDVIASVDRYRDQLLHLHHPRPQIKENGQRFYAGRRLLSWRPTGPIGQLSGPVESADDDLAGLIEHVG